MSLWLLLILLGLAVGLLLHHGLGLLLVIAGLIVLVWPHVEPHVRS